MSLQQAKRLLDKINALYKSMSLDEGEVASIERDLMLSYTRQLYEAFLDINVQSPLTKPATRVEAAPAPPPPPPPMRPEPDPEPVRPRAEMREPSPPPPPRQEQRPAYEPEPPRQEQRPVYQPEPPRQEQRPAYQPEPEPPAYRREPEPAFKPEPPREYQPAPRPEPPRAEPPRPSSSSSSLGDPRINSLFNFQQARELSEKLGEQRVVDLTKSMTINDRLLFANDLFGGDSRAMMTTLDQLNRYSSMEQARPMLEDLARQYKWTEDDRDDTARNFIKLVRRRYA